ncbi:MAG: deoxyribonuclease IV [Nocardiopsaceae bacterium]|nr:deoxyribonuclease IV [Nocardiopsaceae bacterium]
MSTSHPPIGSHATVTGGLATGGLAYAEAVGAEVIQVFVSNPRGWAASAGDPEQDARLRESPIPVFVHAPYLINLGAADEATSARSARAVAHALRRGREIGAIGVVVHAGSATGWPARPPGSDNSNKGDNSNNSHNGAAGVTVDNSNSGHNGDTGVTADNSNIGIRERALRRVAELLLPVLGTLTEDDPDLLIEPMAGQGQVLCARAAELGPYLDALHGHPKAGVCLDTCHLFAAGHDLTKPGGVAETLEAVERAAGPGRVRLVHANDSRLGLGSSRDRHEAIGKGEIGAGPFRELVSHPALKDVPFVAETPGGKTGHARDIALLKEFRDT